MAKGLIENTQSVDREKWRAAIESGEFTYDSPYSSEPMHVDPVNHMSNTCAEVGKVIADTSVPGYNARLDPSTFVFGCMDTVFTPEEVRQLTTNPDVPDSALQTYWDAAAVNNVGG